MQTKCESIFTLEVIVKDCLTPFLLFSIRENSTTSKHFTDAFFGLWFWYVYLYRSLLRLIPAVFVDLVFFSLVSQCGQAILGGLSLLVHVMLLSSPLAYGICKPCVMSWCRL